MKIPMIRKLEEIEQFAAGKSGRIVVVAAHDDNVLASIRDVYNKGYVSPILIGDKEKIFKIAEEVGVDVSRMDIIKETDDIQGARMAVNMVNSGDADIMMKGHIMTADLMRVVLDKEKGLRTNRVINHVGIFEIANYPKLLFITDAGINISPDLKQKAEIIRNAVEVAVKLGIAKPKVAVLSAVEIINPAMQSTLDAAILSKMAQRGQIEGCTVDGPLAMDNAISLDAASHKHIESDVAGDADILVAPNIEAGNILVKTLVFLYKARTCSVITGAKAPLVVTSRADDSISKYYSILLALAMR
jgi:phosphate butyryltransferase